MLLLTTFAAVVSALNDRQLDPELRALIGRRAWLLGVRPLGEDVRFVVVEGGDTPELINAAVGFPITDDHADEPSYEWIEDHGFWFEVAYARGGTRTFIYVENGPGTELGIHYLCLSHFLPDDDRGIGQ